MKRKLMSLLLVLCMVLTMLPMSAFATDTVGGSESVVGTSDVQDSGELEATACTKTEDCTAETHEAVCPKYVAPVVCTQLEGCTGDTHAAECPLYMAPVTDTEPVPVEPTAAEEIQARINDLPDAETLAAMDAKKQNEVYTEVSALYDAIKALTEGADTLKTAKLDAAAAWFSGQVMTLGAEDGYSLNYATSLGNGVTITSVTDKNGTSITSGTKVTPLAQNPFTITIKHIAGEIIDLDSTYTDKDGAIQNGLAMSLIGASYSVLATESKYELWLLDYDHTIVVDGGCSVSISDDTATISGNGAIPSCKWNSPIALSGVKHLIIGTGVTGIGANAFQNNSALESLAFTTTALTSIGQFAFYQNTALRGNLALPEGLLEIGKQAFDANKTGYSFDGTLALPSTLKTIGDYAFRSCQFTGTLTLPPAIESIGNYAFYGQNYAMKFSGELVIPNTITTISEGAFRNCTGITSVVIPDTVTEIQTHAFDSTGIAKLIIPESVGSIGDYAFGSCSSLSTVVLHNADITLGGTNSAFHSAPNSAIFYIKKEISRFSVSGIKAITNGGTFADDTTFAAGTLATPVKEGFAFGGWYDNAECTGTAVTSPTAGSTYYAKWLATSGTCGDPAVNEGKNVTWALTQNNADNANPTYTLTISGTGAMADYTGADKGQPWTQHLSFITKIEIENGVTSVGGFAFMNAGNVLSVSLPEGLTKIGQRGFANCKKMASPSFPSTLTEIGSNPFYDCDGFTNIVLPDSLTTMGTMLFLECSNLTSIVFPNNSSATTIPEEFAKSCSSLKSFVIPNTVTTIGQAAFAQSGIEKMDIPSGVTTVMASAFYECAALKEVRFHSSSVSLTSSVFSVCSSLQTIIFDSANISLNLGSNTYVFSGLANNSVLYIKGTPTQDIVSNVKKGIKDNTALAVTNGGTFADDTTFTAGTLATPTKEGYIFGGWYDNAAFTGTATTTPTAGSTYYAKWREPVITFTNKTGDNAFIYDGTANTLTATLEDKDDAVFTYTYAKQTDGENYAEPTEAAPIYAGYYQVIAKLSGSDRTATAYIEIKPATITVATKTVNVKQGDTTTQQVDLTALELAPALSTVGNVTYALGDTSDTSGILDGAATLVDASKLQFKLNEVVTATHSATVPVTITATSGNYAPVTVTITISVTADTVAPTMTATPASGAATIIGLGDSITVSFSKKMIGTPTIAVTGGTGTARAVLAADGLSMTITPANLVKGTAYTFTVNDLTDVAKNELASNTLTYTTIKAAEASGTAKPTITGEDTIIAGNTDAVPANITIDYTAQATATDQTALNTADNLPSGYTATTVFFELTLKVNGTEVDNAELNRAISVTVPYPVASNTTYKVAHLKANNSVEILDATASVANQTLTFSVTSMSPFMVLSKYTAPGGGSGSSYSYYTIAATAGTGGSISSSGSTSVREGLDKTYTITPNTGYIISDVLVDGKSVGAVKTYTFENVKKGHTISVTFKASEHTNPQTGVDFSDVAESDWFYKAVMTACEKGWFAGTSDTTFSPNASMTRQMLWTVLGRINGQTLTGSGVFDEAKAWAVQQGITDGSNPIAALTREQLVTILWRYAGSPAVTGDLSKFADADNVADYAKQAMAWAVENGIVSGTSATTLSPTGSATRAQVAAILTRFNALQEA